MFSCEWFDGKSRNWSSLSFSFSFSYFFVSIFCFLACVEVLLTSLGCRLMHWQDIWKSLCRCWCNKQTLEWILMTGNVTMYFGERKRARSLDCWEGFPFLTTPPLERCQSSAPMVRPLTALSLVRLTPIMVMVMIWYLHECRAHQIVAVDALVTLPLLPPDQVWQSADFIGALLLGLLWLWLHASFLFSY